MRAGRGVACLEEQKIRFDFLARMDVCIRSVRPRFVKQLGFYLARGWRPAADLRASWEMKMTGTYAKSLLYRLSIKICIITAFENLSGSTRFATSRLVTPAMGKRDGLSGRRETGSESIRLKREISTIGINNYVDTIFTNEKCRNIHR